MRSGYGGALRFAGYDWRTKVSSIPIGPGPNTWTDAAHAVWIDETGRLHLRLAPEADGTWPCAELVSERSFGYGTYRFVLDSAVDRLDPGVVLGLFTWSDDPAYAHRELDVEFGCFGDVRAKYTVQPYTSPGQEREFAPPRSVTSSHAIVWQPGLVRCSSWEGCAPEPRTGTIVAAHTFDRGVPVPGSEQVRLNLWLQHGRPPADGRAVEVVVRRFEWSSEISPC
ncbi:MAG: hypothetical protein JO023_20590 [Chloroflexi bacterium]|nr:hypothetical protein [Chloroflexota bacterium]